MNAPFRPLQLARKFVFCTMNALFCASWLAVLLALSLVSCTKDAPDPLESESEPESDRITVIVTATEATTRTHYDGTSRIKWDASDVLQVLQTDCNDRGPRTNGFKSTKCQTDGLTALFTVLNLYATDDYYFDAICPAANYHGETSSKRDLTKQLLHIPTTQTATPQSFDPKSDLLVAKHQGPMRTPPSLHFRFRRLNALGEMTLRGIPEGEQIECVQIATAVEGTPKNPLAGKLYYDFERGEIRPEEQGDDQTTALTIRYDELFRTTKEGAKIYFSTLPVTLYNMTITVKTDHARYTKTVDLHTRPMPFRSGSMTRFAVNNLHREAFPTVLPSGDYVVLGEADEEFYALSSVNPEAPRNARVLSSTVLPSFDKRLIAYKPEDARLVWHVSGNDYDGYTFVQGDRRLIAKRKSSGQSADLKTSTTETASRFVCTPTSGHRYTVGVPNPDLKLVLCRPNMTFELRSNVRDALLILPAKDDLRPALSTPTNLKVSVAEASNQVTVTWDAVPEAGSYTLCCHAAMQEVATNKATFDLEWNTTHEITVVANPQDENAFKASDSASIKVEIGNDPNAPAEQTMTFDFRTMGLVPNKGIGTLKDTAPLTVRFERTQFEAKEQAACMRNGHFLTISGRPIVKVEFTVTSNEKGQKPLCQNLKSGYVEISAKSHWTWENPSGVDPLRIDGSASFTGIQKLTITYK